MNDKTLIEILSRKLLSTVAVFIINHVSTLEGALKAANCFNQDLTEGLKNYYKEVHGEGVKTKE